MSDAPLTANNAAQAAPLTPEEIADMEYRKERGAPNYLFPLPPPAALIADPQEAQQKVSAKSGKFDDDRNPRSSCSTPAASASVVVRNALMRAWHLGQTYWQQADHDSISEQGKSERTQKKFNALIEETCAILAAMGAK